MTDIDRSDALTRTLDISIQRIALLEYLTRGVKPTDNQTVSHRLTIIFIYFYALGIGS